MGIQDITFTGLIRNRRLVEITGPEFFRALMASGWKEGTGTHFFQQLRKDGPSRGINTPADLTRAIAAGISKPGRDGKTIHRICNRSAFIIYNALTKTLITFSQGDPSTRWDVEESIKHLQTHAVPSYGKGLCATFVREALEAGGLKISRSGSGSAKDYGPRLVTAGFIARSGISTPHEKGDIAVIDGFTKSAAAGIKHDHIDGHLAMFDGTQWISDFKQVGTQPYPGSDYEKAKPKIVIYRYSR